VAVRLEIPGISVELSELAKKNLLASPVFCVTWNDVNSSPTLCSLLHKGGMVLTAQVLWPKKLITEDREKKSGTRYGDKSILETI
jgi:hypothetical protein